MTINSVGFQGTVNELNWATLGPLLGHDRCLGAIGDFAVTASGTKGRFNIGTGVVYGDGILSENTESASFPSAALAPANGQWYLLALNRDWSTRTATLVVRNGPTTAAASPGGATVPAAFPATYQDSPGSSADVELAWVWVGSGATQPIIVPLLLPSDSAVPRRGDYSVRDAMVARFASTVQGRVMLQRLGVEWFEPDAGWTQHYFAEYSANNDAGALPAGWYPVSGKLPSLSDYRNTDTLWNTSAGGTQIVTWNGPNRITQRVGWDGKTMTVSGGGSGRYRISGSLGMVGGSGVGFMQVLLYRNGSIVRRQQGVRVAKTTNLPFSFETTLTPGDRIQIGSRAEASRVPMPAKDVAGGTLTWLDVDYLGPSQGSD